MKKAFCLLPLLAAILLAVGCADRPAVASDETAGPAAATPESARENAASSPETQPVLQELTASAGGYFYVSSPIGENGPVYLTTVDLNDGQQRVLCGKPGCTHSDESCWAYLYSGTEARPWSLEVYTDGHLLYFVYLTDYQHAGLEGAQPESAVYVADLTGTSCPLWEMAGQGPNYCGAFLQDNACTEDYWFTDGDTLWALILSNPLDDAGAQTFAATLYHFAPAPQGDAAPYAAEVVWRQVREGNIGYQGLLDGQILLDLQYPGPDTGSLADNYKNSQSELRLLSCQGTLGEPLARFTNGSLQMHQLVDGQWYTMAAESTELQVTDLLSGQTRTLCTLPIQEGAFSVTPQLAWNGKLVVDVSGDAGDTRYVVDTATGAMTTLPATWAKDGVVSRVPVFCQVAQGRCLLQVGTQDRMLTTMGQDGGTQTFYSPLPVYAVMDLDAYLAGSQDWQVCSLLAPDILL